jgi:hypothetical protein
MLEGGAFENANYIDNEIVDLVLELYGKDSRNQFLLNLLSYEMDLVSGMKPLRQHPTLGEMHLIQSRV